LVVTTPPRSSMKSSPSALRKSRISWSPSWPICRLSEAPVPPAVRSSVPACGSRKRPRVQFVRERNENRAGTPSKERRRVPLSRLSSRSLGSDSS